MGKNARSAAYGRAAFTLIELLVVITIIAILIGLLLGGIAKAYQHAINIQCQHNLGQIAKSVISYTTANRGAIPPCKIIKTSGKKPLYWVNLLAARDIDAQNMNKVDNQQTSSDEKVRTGQASVLLCPSSTAIYVAPNETWSKAIPTDPRANGWYRLGNDDVKTDCSYYWNGYTGNSAAYLGRFPSEVLDENEPDPAKRAMQVHDLSEINQRSRLVMVADGVYFQGPLSDQGGGGGGSGSDIKPERIAARHPGEHRNGGRTNLAFYDGHVESMDRFPDPSASDMERAWSDTGEDRGEQVEGYYRKHPELMDPQRPPQVPIMNRDPKLEMPIGDSDKGPAFLLPRG